MMESFGEWLKNGIHTGKLKVKTISSEEALKNVTPYNTNSHCYNCTYFYEDRSGCILYTNPLDECEELH